MRKPRITTNDFLQMFYLAQQDAAKEVELLRVIKAQYDIDAFPLLQELAAAGFKVNEIEELVSSAVDYTAVVPILLKRLPAIDNERVKGSIISVLRIRALRSTIVPVLLSQFKTLPNNQYFLVKKQIADTVLALADDRFFDDIVALIADKSHGVTRERLVLALGKMKKRSVDVASVAVGLLNSGDMPAPAIHILRRLRRYETKDAIERYLDHAEPNVRREAIKAFSILDC